MANLNETISAINTDLSTGVGVKLRDFLKGKNISPSDYETEYNNIKSILGSLKPRVSALIREANAQTDMAIIAQVRELTATLKSLDDEFNKNILSPSVYAKKLEENKTIDLGDVNIRSTFDDIPLNPNELLKLKPEKLLAKTSKGIEYYQITYNNQTTILRYNPNDLDDEVALYANVNLGGLDNNGIKRLIISAERQGFRDVEMQGSASIRNVFDSVGSVVGTATGMVAGAGAGIGALKYGSYLASVPLLGRVVGAAGIAGAAVLSVKGAVVIGAGVIIGGVVAASTDLDYTSDDYKKDFGSEIDKLKALSNVSYKKQ